MADNTEDLQAVVRQKYAEIAVGTAQGCCGGTSCCGVFSNADDLAQGIGYDAGALDALPAGMNMGLSCGNPLALASLCSGDVVLDIGCGGGFDVFQAGPRVGDAGRVIGVDMTEAMIAKACKALPWYHSHSGLDNVAFRLGTMEALPVDDASVDVVLSNCVINLSADKAQTWKEIFRVLRPGGRLSVSDIALRRPLPASIKQSVEALVGCVAGAMLLTDTLAIMQQTGFTHIKVQEKEEYISSLQDNPLYSHIASCLPPNTSLHDFIVSADIVAQKT